MKRRTLFPLALVFFLLSAVMWVSGQSTGVTAEAIGTANLRSIPSINGELVGSIANGTAYPVIGRSELYPWLLLGQPETEQPLGWVFRDLVTVNGNLANVPFSTRDMSAAAVPTVAPADQSTPAVVQTPLPGAGGGDPTATLLPGLNVTPGAEASAAPLATPTLTLTPTQIPGVTGRVMGEINVRYGPGTDYQPVGRAFAGEVFEITGYHTQFPWLQIRYDASPNGLAWVAQDLLEISGNVFNTRAISTTQFGLPTLTPTPAMRASSSVPGREAVPVSPAFAALGDLLWNGILARSFIPETSQFGALYLQDLQTGEAITYGNEFAFSGTSINKVAILLAYFGVLDGTPNFAEARDIANTMICSENVATNRLLEYVGQGDMLLGADVTTAYLRQLGIERTFITAPYDTTTPLATSTPMPRPPEIPQTDADQERANPNPTNQMTVEEMGWLLSNVYECAYNERGPLLDQFNGAFTPQECRKMLYVMGENTVDGLLKAGVPDWVRVSHKHGWVEDTHGNAGVFFTPGGDYVMVMMLHKPEFLSFTLESLPTLAETSRTVYNYYNPQAPLDVVREGYIPGPDECNYSATDPIVENLANPLFLVENEPGWSFQPAPSAGQTGTTMPTLTPTPGS